MTQLDTARVVLPAPPPCAPWCPGHHDVADQSNPRTGWDIVDPAGVYRVCRRRVHATPLVEVEVQAWSSCHWPGEADEGRDGPRWYPTDQLTVDPFDLITTAVEVHFDDGIQDPDQVEQLSRALAEAATMMRSSQAQLDRVRTLTRGNADRRDGSGA